MAVPEVILPERIPTEILNQLKKIKEIQQKLAEEIAKLEEGTIILAPKVAEELRKLGKENLKR